MGKLMELSWKMAMVSITVGKYKDRRHPSLAALFDEHELVRAGAALMIVELKAQKGIQTPNTIHLLRRALKRETDDFAKLQIRNAIARLSVR